MKDVDRAYIAGLFDGEGCSSVGYAQYAKGEKKQVYGSCRVTVVISNQDRRVLKQVLIYLGKVGFTVKIRKDTIMKRDKKPHMILGFLSPVK